MRFSAAKATRVMYANACTKLGKLPRPSTFEALAGDGYLAVVHADGNGVGAAAGEDDVTRAAFFHRNRVLLRRALHFAIDRAVDGIGTASLLPLMLGGDAGTLIE